MTSNSILAITPHFDNGLWVFDDPNAELVREPFVAGTPEILEAIAWSLHHNIDGRNGFNLRGFCDVRPAPTNLKLDNDCLRQPGASGGVWWKIKFPLQRVICERSNEH